MSTGTAGADFSRNYTRRDTCVLESFDLRTKAGIISPETAAWLRKMVGLPNVVIHGYQSAGYVAEAVISSGLDHLLVFAD